MEDSKLVKDYDSGVTTKGLRNKVLAVVLCYNTDKSTKIVLNKFPLAKDRKYDILLVNDASTDRTKEFIEESFRKFNFNVITHRKNMGVGATIRSGIKYGIDRGYEVCVILAGNNKDEPKQIPRLISAVIDEGYDYVQGSRFVRGGCWDNLPPFRFFMVKLHAFLFSLLTGRRCTDALNGFRAYKLSIFKNPKLDIWQDWLDKYELETYLHYKALRLGYKFKEVPVSKIYPVNWRKVKYTHIRPIIDWWRILNPIFFLLLRIRK